MNRRLILLLAIIALLLGCANSTDKIEVKENSDMPLTKQYLLDHSTLTEEDLIGIDFDAFVKEYELTIVSLEKYDITALLRMYKIEAEGSQSYDYTDIYDKSDGCLTDNDLIEIGVIIWDYHDGNFNSCMVIDREKRVIYYSTTSSLNKIEDNMKAAEWHDGDERFIQTALRNSQITSWQTTYIGTDEGTTGNFSWAIGFRLLNGTCKCYSGHGVKDSGTPDTMISLLQTLKDYYVH